MTVNLRLSLAIFSLGFAIEGAGALYSFATHSSQLPGGTLLLFVSPAFTVLGLLFLFIGRHEWSELHRRRVRHAHGAFGLVVLLLILAAAPVAYFGLVAPPGDTPPWAAFLFGGAVAGFLFFSYVTYALVVFHLVGGGGKAAVGLAVLWSAVIGAEVGAVLAGQFGTFLLAVRARSLSVAGVAAPVSFELSLLFGAYFLFLAAFLDAHRRVAGSQPTGAPPVMPSGS
ncbi:MAG TPA: hypothetical protein VFF67_05710 [Thermoplasmata archaeon]|nr:hypothetical protein [Thermoplasmata archaeon]